MANSLRGPNFNPRNYNLRMLHNIKKTKTDKKIRPKAEKVSYLKSEDFFYTRYWGFMRKKFKFYSYIFIFLSFRIFNNFTTNLSRLLDKRLIKKYSLTYNYLFIHLTLSIIHKVLCKYKGFLFI